MMKALTIVGARPQFIKAAAVSAAIDRHAAKGGASIVEVMTHTGQHYDTQMSDVFFDQLSIRPVSHRLDVGSSSHGAQTGRMIEAIEAVLLDERPDVVIVYGDTNSTLAGALAAAKLEIPIAHVEAGLRSFVRSMPEEINRVLTDHISTLLFCPTDHSVELLDAEGIREGVELVGDVMLDVFTATMNQLPDANPVARSLGVAGEYALVTLHRAANTDDTHRFGEIIAGLNVVATSGLSLIWPVHPRIAAHLGEVELHPDIHLTEPAGYRELLALLRDAEMVLTDSGGLQKEAYWASTPCLTLRDETEWLETVDTGWNRLVAADRSAIAQSASDVQRPASHPALFGNADASALIVERLVAEFG